MTRSENFHVIVSGSRMATRQIMQIFLRLRLDFKKLKLFENGATRTGFRKWPIILIYSAKIDSRSLRIW